MKEADSDFPFSEKNRYSIWPALNLILFDLQFFQTYVR